MTNDSNRFLISCQAHFHSATSTSFRSVPTSPEPDRCTAIVFRFRRGRGEPKIGQHDRDWLYARINMFAVERLGVGDCYCVGACAGITDLCSTAHTMPECRHEPQRVRTYYTPGIWTEEGPRSNSAASNLELQVLRWMMLAPIRTGPLWSPECLGPASEAFGRCEESPPPLVSVLCIGWRSD